MMLEVSVQHFARDIGLPLERLLAALKAAGVQAASPAHAPSEHATLRLLSLLRRLRRPFCVP